MVLLVLGNYTIDIHIKGSARICDFHYHTWTSLGNNARVHVYFLFFLNTVCPFSWSSLSICAMSQPQTSLAQFYCFIFVSINISSTGSTTSNSMLTKKKKVMKEKPLTGFYMSSNNLIILQLHACTPIQSNIHLNSNWNPINRVPSDWKSN